MTPLISIITPITESRRQYLPALLQTVAAQTYPNIEHILVWDDGNIGKKRNVGCRRAKGEFIAHFDSDDWYHPEWVQRLYSFLTDTGADVVGLSELLFYNPEEKQAWLYAQNNQNWVGGATMMYPKSYWEKFPFLEIPIGEDNKFCQNGTVLGCDFINGFAARVHSGNTSAKQTVLPDYLPVKIEDYPFLSAAK